MKTLVYFTKKDNLGWECGSGSYVQFDNIKGRKTRVQGMLKRDYHEVGDGIFWIMQRTHCIKAEYTNRDRLENMMYNDADILEDGEIVEIMMIENNDNTELKLLSKKQYKFKMLGDYSDCGLFEEI